MIPYKDQALFTPLTEMEKGIAHKVIASKSYLTGPGFLSPGGRTLKLQAQVSFVLFCLIITVFNVSRCQQHYSEYWFLNTE